MEEPQQQTLLDEEATLVVSGDETTLVSPRFDDEETLVARPVVPLEADAPVVTPHAPAAPRPAHEYRGVYAPRRTWALALVLVSVLVGGVLGGAGLYLYQRRSQSPPATTAATTEPTPPTVDAAQAPPAPADGGQTVAPNVEPTPQPTEAPTATAPSAEETAPPASDEQTTAAVPAREPENVPAAERRTTPAEAAPKHGKKGARDKEIERRANTQPDGNVARAEEPEARRVDSIFYRPRRATRRARRDDSDVDRLRRIFEGGP